MKRNIRLLALTLVIVMVFALFSGCNKTEPELSPSAASPSPSASSSQSPETSPDEPVTYGIGEWPYSLPIADTPVHYSLYAYDRPFLWPYIDNYDENLVQSTLRDQTNILFDFSWFTGPEQLQINTASRDFFDVYWNVNAYYTGGLAKAYADDVIIRLNDLAYEYMPNYMSWLETDTMGMKAAVDAQGDMLAIYQLIDTPSLQQGTLIRKDWLDALGMNHEDMITYDDYYNYLMGCKIELGVPVPAYMFSNGTTCMPLLGAGFGVNSRLNPESTYVPWQQENGVIQYGPMQDGYLEYLKLQRKWYEDGLYNSDFLSHKDQRFLDDWDGVYTGKYAMIFRNGWGTDEPQSRGREYNPDYTLIAVPDAVHNEGDQLQLCYYSYANIFLEFDIVLSSTCPDPELICRYYDYCYSNDGSLLCNYGIEGLSFEYVNGEPRFIESYIYDNPVVGDAGYQLVRNVCLGTNSGYLQLYHAYDQFNSPESLAGEAIIKSNLNLGDITTTKNVMAAINVSSEHSTDYAAIMAEIQTYANEWVAGFIVGNNSEEDWENYKSRIMSMDFETARGWMQEAYDEFMNR